MAPRRSPGAARRGRRAGCGAAGLALLGGLALVAAPAAGEPPRPGGLPPVDAAPLGPGAAERMAEIQRRIQAAAVYPPIAQARGISGESRVAFRILPDGRPEEIETVASSGSPTLDRAAERAVAEAAPLPRMIGRVVVPVRFVLREAD